MTFLTNRSVPPTQSQPDSQRPDPATLPTMYDLPSEFPEEPGLPDEFHDFQPQLLSRTLHLQDYATDQKFTGTDLNVYYDIYHTIWHKRPDWFLAVDVPRLYDGYDWRNSYVTWHEGQSPAIIVEFLSLNTEKEDLGRFYRKSDKVPGSDIDPNSKDLFVALTEADKRQMSAPPSKFTVYEQYLKTPHYIVYSRYTRRLRYFRHNGHCYEEQPVSSHAPMIWLNDLNIGLGLWDDYYEGMPGPLLRWCDAAGNWFLSDIEKERLAKEQERLAKEQERLAKEQERLAKEKAQVRVDKLAAKLRELGIDPDDL